jgi:2-iminobutanoate/2-iminopropanoate deaminase
MKAFHLNREAEHELGFSQAVAAGSLLYISGTVSIDDQFQILEADNVEGQYHVIYRQLKATLEAHGLGFANVVKETIFTEDLDSFFATGNAVRKKYYEGLSYYPATTAVEVRKIGFPGHLVEIEMIAQLA